MTVPKKPVGQHASREEKAQYFVLSAHPLNWTNKRIADHFGRKPHTVGRWLARGIDNIQPGKSTGRPPTVNTPANRAELVAVLEENPWNTFTKVEFKAELLENNKTKNKQTKNKQAKTSQAKLPEVVNEQ